jgi:hypothetical protein
MIEFKRLVSIFVEGPTDVEIYRIFLRKCYDFCSLSLDKEKEVKKFLRIKIGIESLFPHEYVRFLLKDDILVLLQAKQGKDILKRFTENVVESFKEIKRKIQNVKNSLNIDLISFIIFDKKVPETLDNFRDPEGNLNILYQQNLPEEIIIELVKNCQNIQQMFEELLRCWEKINDGKGDENKRKVNLLKSLIGERCYSHLLEELIDYLKDCNKLKSLLPEIIVKFFN